MAGNRKEQIFFNSPEHFFVTLILIREKNENGFKAFSYKEKKKTGNFMEQLIESITFPEKKKQMNLKATNT